MQKLSDILLRLAFGLALLSFLATGAKAQEPEAKQGIWCDTIAQIEMVVTKGTELGGAAQGIEAVNAAEPQACIYTAILGVRGKDIKIIATPDGELAIVPFLVHRVSTPMGPLPLAEPKVWFTLLEPVKKAGRDA